jgi:uncharacterized membrane-anchored protein YitT (DUF2179 family)
MNSKPIRKIVEILRRPITKNSGEKKRVERNGLSGYSVAKQFLRHKTVALSWIRSLVFISLGVLSAGFGLKGFLLPNEFIDGGVTGISLLVNVLTDYPLSILVIIINVPFIILGYFQIGKTFAIKSVIAIVGLALVLVVIDYPIITSDKLLIAVFGGFFLGGGIGLAIRGGGVLDGTEVIAIYLSRKTGLTIGDIMFMFNIIIFSVAAYLLSMETALYSILTYLAASKTVDFIVDGVEEYIGVTVISPYSEQIKVMITEQMGQGLTIYDGKSGYRKPGESVKNIDIIYIIITRLEIAKFQTEIQNIDPNAFIVMNCVMDLQGGMVKKRRF